MKKLYIFLSIIITALIVTTHANAGEADVVDVKITKSSGDSYHFDVTVKHGDTGWDHYADRWEVLDGKNNILGTRVLFHPHETEQPFTRSLSGVKIPKSITSVTIRAHDKVHEFGGREMTLKVPH